MSCLIPGGTMFTCLNDSAGPCIVGRSQGESGFDGHGGAGTSAVCLRSF